MTVLTIIQDAVDRLELPELTSVVGSTNPDAKQFLQLLIAEGKSLLKEDPSWSILIGEHEFQTVAQQEEYALPDDFQRMINNTAWDRNQYWQVRGGVTPQQWQVIRSGLYQTARLSSNFRIKSSSDKTKKAFYLDPIPGTVQDEDPRTLVFEYYRKWWVYQNGTFYERPQGDTNDVLYDEELMTQGVRWRWRQAHDLPYAALMQEYMDYRKALIGQDRAPPTLTINEQQWVLPIGNIPDTGFGAP